MLLAVPAEVREALAVQAVARQATMRTALAVALFPACAGVILEMVVAEEYAQTFPRMCGGDPIAPCHLDRNISFSPHVRG